MGTILTEVSNFDPQIICPNPGEPVRASDTLGTVYLIAGIGPNGGVIYAALSPLARVRHLGGIAMSLSVTAVVNDITIQLATDGLGNVTSTANDVVTAFNAVPAAIALATATAQGAGTGIAGVNANFVAIGQDEVGSIRPGFQHFTNRTRYLYNKVLGILFGTISHKAIVADGTGDLVVTPVAGDVVASHDVSADHNVVALNNMIATNNINAILGNIQSALGDVIAGNELNGDHLQVNRSIGGTSFPTTTVPLGQANIGNLVLGSASIDAAGALIYGVNINSTTRTGTGKFTVVFNVSCSNAIPLVSINRGAADSAYLANVNLTTSSPITVEIDTWDVSSGGVPSLSSHPFYVWVLGE